VVRNRSRLRFIGSASARVRCCSGVRARVDHGDTEIPAIEVLAR
jgi:hypothetical protein